MKRKLSIEGMKCKHCVQNLRDALTEDIMGIKVIDISLEEKSAIIDMEDSVNVEDIKKIVEELGFYLISVE